MPRTFVLVPGAWHGGWAWRPVARRLCARGHRAITVTLPGLTDGDEVDGLRLADAVDHLLGVLSRCAGTRATLVGHSWGGFPISGAAFRVPERIERLVYVNGFVPEDGRTFLDELPPNYGEVFRRLAEPSGNRSLPLLYEPWRRALIQDAHERVQRTLHALLVPQPYGYCTSGLDRPPVRSLGLPTSYLQNSEDRALPAGEWWWSPRFPARLGVDPVRLPGSHESFLTRPAEMADALLST